MSDVLTRLTAALADRYRLERELGAGGMATVFLAHDLKHERDVAIKVLHPDLGAALGAERFLSEIKVTAKLQHPHILPLLDSGAADGLLYYVMPYVRGETLRARLERERQLPIGDAVRIAREVAAALEHAHAQGIVHRDIKPENILLQDGAAVVADFGIALAVQSAGGQRMTQTGLSLGTPQYMSPEQAMGEKFIDARSDIYALGAVTYEMLAGEPPFTGASVQAIVAKVLSERPVALTVLRDTVPVGIEKVVLTSLAKLPADRVASAREFGEMLTRAVDGDADGTGAGRSRSAAPAAPRWRAGAVVTAVALIAAAGAFVWGQTSATAPGDDAVVRMVLERAPGEIIPIVIQRTIAISRDGSMIAYVGTRANAPQGIFLRRLNALDAPPLAPGGSQPAFSPDGASLAFLRDNTLYRMPVNGGAPIVISATWGTRGGLAGGGMTWTDDNLIVGGCLKGLCAVPAGGGETRTVLEDTTGIEYRSPVALPNGGGVLLSRYSNSRSAMEIVHVDVASGRLSPTGVDGLMALGVLDDALLYVTVIGDVMAVRFDMDSKRSRGAPVRLASGVMTIPGNSGVAFAALSDNGHLVFHDVSTMAELVRVGSDGVVSRLLPDTQWFEYPRYSPDGRRIALDIVDQQTRRRAIWVMERASGILTRVTENSPDVDRDRVEWTPDGTRILYRVTDGRRLESAMRPVDRPEPEQLVVAGTGSFNEVVMLNDGKTIVGRVNFGESNPPPGVGTQQAWWWRLGDSTKIRLTSGRPTIVGPRPSPDGKWIAYVENSPDGRGVFIAPFPGPGARVRVNKDRGGLPVWRRDGKALLFSDGTGLVEVQLRFTPAPEVVTTRRIADGGISAGDMLHAPFDVGPDNSLLGVRPVREPRTIVIRNFAAEVRRAIAGATK